MSSPRRRMAQDDGILASLERGSERAQMRRSWLAFGITVTLLLTAMVAWLAWNNATSVRALSVEVHHEPLAVAGAAPQEDPVPPPDSTDAEEYKQAAAIVDVPSSSEAAASTHTPHGGPALVMLAPDGDAPASNMGPTTVPATATTQPTTATPAKVSATTAAEATKVPAMHSAAAATTALTTPPPLVYVPPAQDEPRRSRAARPERNARAKAGRSQPPRHATRAAPAKTGRTAAASKAKPRPADPVDSDVALISAIVAHSSHHAAERAQQQACANGKKCAPKPDSQP